ncbi:DNA-directed RNA polymerase I subunit RPA43 [Actinidia chinensis var. chinensis]|uniref:DNA-directed RNA polymerase subunit n=1 Tax=Actinidia chinensis var. chinensis TaxID=1590841 RepID=A0A2R6QXQ4_ACTCC|nr:DNA-directed RNA polymerase I subunit RPA43 [Actinidia chinensis var. chinensis]
MEGLKVSDANLVVYVHPSKATNVSQAILCELSSLLFKFSEIFDGVVLDYDVNTLSEVAKILPGVHPYFGVRLQAKLLLFHPKTDMLLEGKVVKLGQQSIHVIVLGFSSAIIIEEDIREEFKYKVKRGEEVFVGTSHKRHKIKVGTILRFLVKSFDEEILHISGSLVPPHTGSVRWLDKNGEDWSHADRSSKKRKESVGREQMWEHDKPITDASTLSMNTDHTNKKSKGTKKK